MMNINIKENFGPVIKTGDHATINIGADDAIKRYKEYLKATGQDIQDAEVVDESSNTADNKTDLTSTTQNPPPKNNSENEGQKRKLKKSDVVKLRPATFKYIYFKENKGFVRLRGLFDLLKSDDCGWLDKYSGIKEWEEIFSGELSSAMLVWKGSQSQLKFLFKYMIDGGLIKPTAGFGPYEILGSHFKKPDDTPFVKWNDYKTAAARDSEALLRMANYLDIKISVSLDDIKFGSGKTKDKKGADSHINPYVHQKVQKNYKEEGEAEFEAEMERNSRTDW